MHTTSIAQIYLPSRPRTSIVGTCMSRGPAGSWRLVPRPVASPITKPVSASRALSNAFIPALTDCATTNFIYSLSYGGTTLSLRLMTTSNGVGAEWVWVTETIMFSYGTPVALPIPSRIAATCALFRYRMSWVTNITCLLPLSR